MLLKGINSLASWTACGYGQCVAYSQALQQLAMQVNPEQLNKAVKLLSEAENIYVIGLRRSFSVASYLVYALRHLERRAFLIDGLGGMFTEQLSLVNPKDVVIAISYSPYAREAVEVVEIDNAGIVGAEHGVVAILSYNLLLHELQEAVLDVSMNKKVIGSNTCLSAIEQLTPYDALGCNAEVGVAVDNARALATQFECYGGEVSGGGLQYTATVLVATGIEDVVPL